MRRLVLVSKIKRLSNQGQSLLEIVVLIGLALVIVTGLTVVTINGLKNSQFSQNQAQATRLAQDAVDKIRTMRDQNCPVNIGAGPTSYYWYDASTYPNQIWSIDPSANGFKFVTVSCGSSQPVGTGLQSITLAAVDDSISAALQTTFQRKITIQNVSATQKKISVTVSWVDISGSHQSSLGTIIGQN